MTARARRMLNALEDGNGAATRHELWQHAGRFYLTNNAAAELRRAGIDVDYDRDSDTYRLLDQRHGLTTSPPEGQAHASGTPPVPLIEQTDGQIALEVVA